MRLNTKFINMCLIVVSFLSIASTNRNDVGYVQNLRDFKTHTETHIQNVQRLGMYLFYHHRFTYFKDVPESVLRQKLLYHDFEKLASKENLEQYGYNNKEPLSVRLFAQYGKRKNSSPEIPKLINELNSIADLSTENIFKSYNYLNEDGSPNAIAQKILLIEKIADLVDREKNPVSKEEFGVQRMAPATQFLEHPMEKALAAELAKNYPEIVRPNPLLYIVRHENTPPVCSALFH